MVFGFMVRASSVSVRVNVSCCSGALAINFKDDGDFLMF